MNGIKACLDTGVFPNVLNREIKYHSYFREIFTAVENGILGAIIPALPVSEMLTGFYIERRNVDA